MTKMQNGFLPGKGLRFPLQHLGFLQDACDAIEDLSVDTDSQGVLDGLVAEGWTYTKDKFGESAHKEEHIDENNTIRITYVHSIKIGGKVDIRNWYKPTGP